MVGAMSSFEPVLQTGVLIGRAFSLSGETGMGNGKPAPRRKSSIGVKAGAAEAGKYTREAGVLAYYEVSLMIISLSEEHRSKIPSLNFR
jgi:hypothetical protein